MEVERDPVSGRETTGHIWNGIKELDTPVPRGVLIFLIVTHIFAFAWWVLMPTWPLGDTYTKGILETDQRRSVEKHLLESQEARASWATRIETESFAQIEADPDLMTIVRSTGHQLFGDNCAACHGVDGKGGKNYPDLTDNDWIWGGTIQQIEETMRIGVNADHPQARISQMPSFGRDGILDPDKVKSAATYVYALSHPEYVTPGNRAAISAGYQVFQDNCSVCHGENARGNKDIGAPNLTDAHWIYGGDLADIVETVHGGRQGHMPTWDERLTDTQIKILALYVHDLGAGTR
jgi:cytochrome c oxidase cbb3-type subunit 3